MFGAAPIGATYLGQTPTEAAAPPSGPISLGSGDLTTEFDKWLDANVSPDAMVDLRDTLASAYGYSSNVDLTTLLARFLRDRS